MIGDDSMRCVKDVQENIDVLETNDGGAKGYCEGDRKLNICPK